jgi:hypothetical protein
MQVQENSTVGINLKNDELRGMLKKVDPKDTGKDEKLNSGSGKIENVVDAHNELKKLVILNKVNNDEKYKEFDSDSDPGSGSLGSLTIYQSGLPMQFIR